MVPAEVILRFLGCLHAVFGTRMMFVLFGSDAFREDLEHQSQNNIGKECLSTVMNNMTGTADVMFTHQFGVGMLLLVVSFTLQNRESVKQLFPGIFAFDLCVFGIAAFNQTNQILYDKYGDEDPLVWGVIVVSAALSLYGYVREEIDQDAASVVEAIGEVSLAEADEEAEAVAGAAEKVAAAAAVALAAVTTDLDNSLNVPLLK